MDLDSSQTCDFHYAIFCPNIAHTTPSNSVGMCVRVKLTLPTSLSSHSLVDQTNHTVTHDCQLSRCYANQQCFKEVMLSTGEKTVANEGGSVERSLESGTQTRVLLSVSDAIQFLESMSPAQVAVLVTGSLHLVGSAMSVLKFTVDDV